MVPFSNGPLISGKPLLIDHHVHVLSSGLPYLNARLYREPPTIGKRHRNVRPYRITTKIDHLRSLPSSTPFARPPWKYGRWDENKTKNQTRDPKQRCLMDLRRSLLGAWLSPARAGLRPIYIDPDYLAAPAALLSPSLEVRWILLRVPSCLSSVVLPPY